MTNSFQIAAVARMTGLSTDTIRAWERRYALVRPSRSPAGVRLYSEDDVTRLDLARAVVVLGHPISRVAPLSDSELRRLLQATSPAPSGSNFHSAAAEQVVVDVLQAIEQYELAQAETLLNSAALLFTPTALIVDVLSPFMREIGTRWQSNTLSIAQEHFASNLVRNLLGTLMRLRPPNGEDAILFATPPGEYHEFGILFAAALASVHGHKALVLGPSVPAKEVLRAARKTQAKRIVIGLVYQTDDTALSEYIREIKGGMAAPAQLCVGGEAALTLPVGCIPAGVEIAGNLADFALRLSRTTS